MLPDSIKSAFDILPGCQDELFQTLWNNRGLKFGPADLQVYDEVDENCARLICATITCRGRLLVILPDFQPHRPALLFATALMRCIPRELITPQKEVLYFGTTIGIREHLDQVRIRGFSLKLSEVFHQQNVKRPSRGGRSSQVSESVSPTRLPRVVTVYSPADPVHILEEHDPQLVAIDLGESAKADWLQVLLEETVRRRIAVVAWGTNPLSECVSVFKQKGEVIVWPHQIHKTNQPCESNGAGPTIVKSNLHPLVLESTEVTSITGVLEESSQLLARLVQRAGGRLALDTLRQHWVYLRAIESLFVPYTFYETEAPHFWGLKSIGHLQAACEHFRKTYGQFDASLASELDVVLTSCKRIEDIYSSSDPPLWSALCNICVEEPPAEEARLLIFPGSSRKQLFLLALLAYHNITEADLNEIRTWVLTLEELRQLVHHPTSITVTEGMASIDIPLDLNWRPVLSGLPGKHLTPKLLPVLSHANVDIIVFPHQVGSLQRRADEWSKAVALDINKLSEILDKLGASGARFQLQSGLQQTSDRVQVAEPISLDARTARRKQYTNTKSLWKPDNPVESVALLLRVDEGDLDSAPFLQEHQPSTQASEQELWCDEAIQLHFKSGSSLAYAADEFINVIVSGPSGPEVEERSVRSLRVGDRVVLIHGQQRQSFYDLIISRIHQHPSMMLHLSLIQRWQEDVVTDYQKWSEHGFRNLEQLLSRMNERGSALVSTATLQNWLRGYTLCPQDALDLLRIAEILSMDFVRKNYQRIHKAASTLRGLHRGVANKLNRWLQQQAKGIESGNEDDVIDSGLGLTFGDLKSSLSVQLVAAVRRVEGPIARSSLGKLEF